MNRNEDLIDLGELTALIMSYDLDAVKVVTLTHTQPQIPPIVIDGVHYWSRQAAIAWAEVVSNQKQPIQVFRSDRGMPLLCQEVYDTPTITLENYEKWYNIFVIQPDGTVEIVNPGLIDELNDGTLWVDHTFHPKLLLLIAKHYKGHVPATTLELAAGRWVMEDHPNFAMDYYLDEEQ